MLQIQDGHQNGRQYIIFCKMHWKEILMHLPLKNSGNYLFGHIQNTYHQHYVTILDVTALFKIQNGRQNTIFSKTIVLLKFTRVVFKTQFIPIWDKGRGLWGIN